MTIYQEVISIDSCILAHHLFEVMYFISYNVLKRNPHKLGIYGGLTLKKYLTFLVVMILTITCLFSGTNTYRVLAQTMPRLKVESAMVVENINGQILYADEIEDLVEVGELSKVLILYLSLIHI